ncbi:MAG TPA: alkaline phosphatase family protein [Candidatus Cybelea sp.]
MMKRLPWCLAGAVALSVALAAGCGGAGGGPPGGAVVPGGPALTAPGSIGRKIQHVVIIIQENRSLENLFRGFPGADTVDYGKTSKGQLVRLLPEPLDKPMDIDHTHLAFATEYDGGKMDGFDLVQSHCNKNAGSGCRQSNLHAYGYVPKYQIEPYWTLATAYTLADHMFQTNQGPSFPAHQYLVSGTSKISNKSPLWAAENPHDKGVSGSGGCDSKPGTLVSVIDPQGQENRQVFPCFTRVSLMDRITAHGLTWHYYQAHIGRGLWNGPDAIRNIRYGPLYKTDVVAPPKQVLVDIAAGNLANVVWVTPTRDASDHPGVTDGSGPSWVASIVNAIGASGYWNDTAIFITWDDWGGWYDHVPPRQLNAYELGFRVPLIVVSAYAKQHYVSHREHEFASILKFTERAFGLPSLQTTDVRADDLTDCFDFSKPPARFKPVSAPLGRDYFLSQPLSNADPDDDW